MEGDTVKKWGNPVSDHGGGRFPGKNICWYLKGRPYPFRPAGLGGVKRIRGDAHEKRSPVTNSICLSGQGGRGRSGGPTTVSAEKYRKGPGNWLKGVKTTVSARSQIGLRGEGFAENRTLDRIGVELHDRLFAGKDVVERTLYEVS